MILNPSFGQSDSDLVVLDPNFSFPCNHREKSEVGYKTTHGLVCKPENFGIINVEKKGGSKIVSLNKRSPYIDALENLGSIDSQPLREVAEQYAKEVIEEFLEIKSVIYSAQYSTDCLLKNPTSIYSYL